MINHIKPPSQLKADGRQILTRIYVTLELRTKAGSSQDERAESIYNYTESRITPKKTVKLYPMVKH